MQILVPDPSYDHEDKIDRDKFLAELDNRIAEISKKFELTDTNLGRGADWPVFLITIGGLFLLGKPINENLQAWLELSQKFNKFLGWVLTKCVGFRVDENGATLVAISDIVASDASAVNSIDKKSSTYIPFLEWNGRDVESLSHHPDGIFSQTYLVNKNLIFIYAIKSDGKIESKSVHEVERPWG